MVSLCLFATAICGYSQTPVTNDPPYYGPFNAENFFSDGDGLKKPLVKDNSVLHADSPWTLYAWVRPAEAAKVMTLIAGLGDPTEEFSRYLAVDGVHAILWMGNDNSLSGPAVLDPEKWHFLAGRIFDGERFQLFSDGTQVAVGTLDLGSVSPVLELRGKQRPQVGVVQEPLSRRLGAPANVLLPVRRVGHHEVEAWSSAANWASAIKTSCTRTWRTSDEKPAAARFWRRISAWRWDFSMHSARRRRGSGTPD